MRLRGGVCRLRVRCIMSWAADIGLEFDGLKMIV